ncbi:HNH endonuclease [Streptomyces sp. NPDC056909]|uniref:HNH endonuclease n=1 Tax=Streptomyces sp. NPDC056909 TaxID=3345963 RepID=UPI0036B69FA9
MPRPRSWERRALRALLAERDGAGCFYCGTPFGRRLAGATFDHLVPKSLVPTWDAAALVLACEPCNQAKSDTLPQALLRPAPGTFGPGLVPLEAGPGLGLEAA